MVKKIAAIFSVLLFSSSFLVGQAAYASSGITASKTATYTSYIQGSAIWTGEIPTSITFGGSSSYDKLEFPIRGLLPADVLKQSLYGAEIEFELWADNGKKIASDTVYTFDWNPVGGPTWVSMYMSKSDVVGSATMMVSTKRYVSSNGLISRYFYDNFQTKVALLSGNVPSTITDLAGNLQSWNAGLDYSFSSPASDSQLTGYELGISAIKDNQTTPTLVSSFGDPIVLKRSQQNSFSVSTDEILAALGQTNTPNAKYFLIRVRALSAIGPAPWSAGVYTETSALRTSTQVASDQAAKQAAEAAAAEKAAADAAARAAQKTIVCAKGKVVKYVTGLKPKCPKGYTLKK